MPSYQEESGRKHLCVRHGCSAGAQGGGLCEASHCYTIPEGGYQSHGSQDIPRGRGRAGLQEAAHTQHRHSLSFTHLIKKQIGEKVGAAEIIQIEAEGCSQERLWLND